MKGKEFWTDEGKEVDLHGFSAALTFVEACCGVPPNERFQIVFFAFFNETIHPPFFLNSRDLKKRFVIESPNSMK